MDVGTLEDWLWDAACEIRGPLDAPKFKDYILPLVFLKRLSDVFDDEITRLANDVGGEDKALAVADTDHSVIPSGIYAAGRTEESTGRDRGPGETQAGERVWSVWRGSMVGRSHAGFRCGRRLSGPCRSAVPGWNTSDPAELTRVLERGMPVDGQ